jgi:hypothetical protein
VRCGNLAPARLGTASIPARTVPSTSDHSRSTASASSSEPRACAAGSSARPARAFAAFSPSFAWVQALAQNTPPPSQQCLKDAFTSKPQALLATVHVIAGAGGEAARSSPRTVSFAGTPKRLWRILFFSLGPITVILKSLQIRLQRSER